MNEFASFNFLFYFIRFCFTLFFVITSNIIEVNKNSKQTEGEIMMSNML